MWILILGALIVGVISLCIFDMTLYVKQEESFKLVVENMINDKPDWDLVPKQFNHLCVSPNGERMFVHRAPEYMGSNAFSFQAGAILGHSYFTCGPLHKVPKALINSRPT